MLWSLCQSVSTFDRGVQASIETTPESSEGSPEGEAEGNLAVFQLQTLIFTSVRDGTTFNALGHSSRYAPAMLLLLVFPVFFQAGNTLKKALTLKVTSPLLSAAEVGGTPTAADTQKEAAPKTFRKSRAWAPSLANHICPAGAVLCVGWWL